MKYEYFLKCVIKEFKTKLAGSNINLHMYVILRSNVERVKSDKTPLKGQTYVPIRRC